MICDVGKVQKILAGLSDAARAVLDWLRSQPRFRLREELTVNTAKLSKTIGVDYPKVRRALERFHRLGLIVWQVGSGTHEGTRLVAADVWADLPRAEQRMLFGADFDAGALALTVTPPRCEPVVRPDPAPLPEPVPEPLPERTPPRIDPPQPPAPETVAIDPAEAEAELLAVVAAKRAASRTRDISSGEDKDTSAVAEQIQPRKGLFAAARRFLGLAPAGDPPRPAVPAPVRPIVPPPAQPAAPLPAPTPAPKAAERIEARAAAWRVRLRDPKTAPWILRWLAFECDPASAGGLAAGKRVHEAEVERWLAAVDDLERRGKILPTSSRGAVFVGCIRKWLQKTGRNWPSDLRRLAEACRRMADFELDGRRVREVRV